MKAKERWRPILDDIRYYIATLGFSGWSILYMNDEYNFVRECVEHGERVLLLAFCVSNRHRSVAFATCLGAAFWPMPVMVIHLDTYVDGNWQTMRCGGRCDQCGERFQSAASATALRNQVISHLSPAALGPLQAQQVRQRSMPPDPAALGLSKAERSGPAARVYHRLCAASVSGAGSDATRRPAEPPSTPRATRNAPQSSTTAAIADVTFDDKAQGVEYWKMRAIRAEAQMRKDDQLRMVRAEADALRERAAAAERELIIHCGDESDRSRSRSASPATSRQPSRDPSLRPGMGARQREESIKEELEEQDEPSNVVMEEKEEEEHCEIPGLNRSANLTPGEIILRLLGNRIRRMLRDTGKATVDRDGWFGPVEAGGNSGDVLFHNVRWWSRPRGGDCFVSNGSILGRSPQNGSFLQVGIRPGARRGCGNATD